MNGEAQIDKEIQPTPRSKKSLEQPKNHLPKSKYDVKKRAKAFTQSILLGESRTQALVNAGYSKRTAQIGDVALLTNPEHLKPFISILEEKGVTDIFLAEKTKSLLDAQKTEYAQKDGIFTDERIVPALETQRKTLELATKLKGHLKERSEGDINIGLMQMVVQAVRSGEE